MRYILPLGLAVSCFMAAPASSQVVIYDEPGPVQPDENVLLPTEQLGTTVNGFTNNTNTSVTFESTNGELLTTPANGQARIEAVDGSLDQLLFYLTDPLLSFTEVEFNLFDAIQGTTSVLLTFSGGLSQSFSLGNGQNFFGARADPGSYITSVAFDTNALGVSDVRQVRIGGIAPIGAVPEPATWGLMLLGFAGIGFVLRRRKAPEQRLRVSFS